MDEAKKVGCSVRLLVTNADDQIMKLDDDGDSFVGDHIISDTQSDLSMTCHRDVTGAFQGSRDIRNLADLFDNGRYSDSMQMPGNFRSLPQYIPDIPRIVSRTLGTAAETEHTADERKFPTDIRICPHLLNVECLHAVRGSSAIGVQKALEKVETSGRQPTVAGLQGVSGTQGTAESRVIAWLQATTEAVMGPLPTLGTVQAPCTSLCQSSYLEVVTPSRYGDGVVLNPARRPASGSDDDDSADTDELVRQWSRSDAALTHAKRTLSRVIEKQQLLLMVQSPQHLNTTQRNLSFQDAGFDTTDNDQKTS